MEMIHNPKLIWKKVGARNVSPLPGSSDVELKRTKAATNGAAARTAPARAVFNHEHVHALAADAAYALGASIGMAQQCCRVACCAVDLHILRH